MIPQQRFKLTRQAMLLATISAAFPVPGYCIGAGQVIFVVGNVESVAADGSRHPLSKGAEINAGEAINTAAGARAQVRFSDGGFVSLQPNTLFRVDEFNFKGKADGEEKGFFSLLKGGLRAITGLIGHVNRNTYQVRTPAATIGIRGTGYNAVLRDDGLFVNVGEGAISLSNKAGLLVVTAGGAAFVADFNTAPAPTTQPPSTPPAGLQEPTYSVSDQRDSSGNSTLIPDLTPPTPPPPPPPPPPSLVSGPGYALSYAYLGSTCSDCVLLAGSNGLTGVDATFSGTSQLIAYSGLQEIGSLGAAAVTFSATDGIIGWGRWDGDTAGNAIGPNPMVTNLSGQVPVFHYVVGIPTAAMPTTGTATYSLLGYTSPTATDGSSGYSVNGTLAASFDTVTAAPNVQVNMTVANTSNTYAIAGSVPITNASFAGTVATTGCFSGCTTSINGFFAGTNASRAGLTYSIYDPGFPGIQGAAAFTKN